VRVRRVISIFTALITSGLSSPIPVCSAKHPPDVLHNETLFSGRFRTASSVEGGRVVIGGEVASTNGVSGYYVAIKSAMRSNIMD